MREQEIRTKEQHQMYMLQQGIRAYLGEQL